MTRSQRGTALTRCDPPNDDKLEVRDYDVQAKQNSTPIDEKPYPRLATGMRPSSRIADLRGEPALFAVQGLRGTAGFGAMPMRGGSAGRRESASRDARPAAAEIRGQRWVVLTGLVPYDKELLAFEDALRNAGPADSLHCRARPALLRRLRRAAHRSVQSRRRGETRLGQRPPSSRRAKP